MFDVPENVNHNFLSAVDHGRFDWLAAATRFFICVSSVHKSNAGGRGIWIEHRKQIDGSIKWIVIMENCWVLGKDKQYYYEPSPSNRTDEFIKNTRFDSKEQALALLIEYENNEQNKNNPPNLYL